MGTSQVRDSLGPVKAFRECLALHSLVMAVSRCPSYTHEYRYQRQQKDLSSQSLVMEVSRCPSYTHEYRYQRQQRELSSHCLWLCMYQDVLVTHTSTDFQRQQRDISSHCLWLCMYQDVLVTHTSADIRDSRGIYHPIVSGYVCIRMS